MNSEVEMRQFNSLPRNTNASPNKNDDQLRNSEMDAPSGTTSSRVARGLGQIGKASGNLVKRVAQGLNPFKLKSVIVGENVDQSKLKPRTHEFIQYKNIHDS